jgi:hypothetical protein
MSRTLKTFLVTAAILAAVASYPAQPASASTRGRYSGGACHAAVDRYWPVQHRAWAHRIVARESGGQPTAANRRSSARGCFQMLLRYSSPFYRAVGCSNYMWSNAACNVRAALVMFTRHGKAPWRMNY